jgi:hypothetical protein
MPPRPTALVAFRLVLVAALTAASPGVLRATDFVRGDANSDTRVSYSDIHYLLRFLFEGGSPPECLNAADANDDGRLQLSDAISIFLAHADGRPIPSPFPNPGSDPTPNEDAFVDCDDYGGGSPLADPGARIRILDVVSAGGESATAVIRLAISNTAPMAGFAATFRIAGGPIAGYTGPISSQTGIALPVDLSGAPENRVIAFVRAAGGVLSFGYLRSAIQSAPPLPPGEDVAVVELPVCLATGTVAGVYSLALETAELIDDETGRVIEPELLGGTLTVDAGVPASSCRISAPFECPEPQGDPETLEARFSLGEGAAPPEETVTVPLRILANADIQGYAVSVDFNEEVLQAVDVLQAFEKPDGSRYGFYAAHINNDHNNPGSGGVDEGTVTVASVFSFIDHCNNIPANMETDALDLVFQVRSEAGPGSTPVDFLDGGQSGGQPIINRAVALGQPIDPSFAGSFIFVNGRVSVLPDGSLFVRGDTNSDATVDLSDAQATLSFLFLGRFRIRCYDAADANDDGRLDIADPIRTLQFLFLGGQALPAPNGKPGDDPTPDSLRCFSLLAGP